MQRPKHRAVNPAHAAQKEQRKLDIKRAKSRQKESKHTFLKSLDCEELVQELMDLDDMQFNPNYGIVAKESADGGWVMPGMHREKLSDTAIDMKRERINLKIEEITKMYEDLKDTGRVQAVRKLMAKYNGSKSRKANYNQAIKLAKNVELDDIIMPSGGPDLSKKRPPPGVNNERFAHSGGNRIAIEAATRAKNRIRGVPPPPNLALPRTFKRFKSGKAPPPPPPKKLSQADRSGPNYQQAQPTSEMYYETNAPVTLESSFVPSGTKLAKRPDKSLGRMSGATLSAGPSRNPPPPPTKSINATEMQLFVPRGLKSTNDTVTIKRAKKAPPPPPKATGNKDQDEYNKFMHSLSGALAD